MSERNYLQLTAPVAVIPKGAPIDITITLQEDPNALQFYAHRSGHETHQYCPRKRYLAYHHLGTGVNAFPPIYFDIGSAVHIGLGWLLEFAADGPGSHTVHPSMTDFGICREGVRHALEFWHASPVYLHLGEYERKEQDTLIAGLVLAFYFRAWPAFIAKFQVLQVEAASDDPIQFELQGQPAVLHLLSRPDAIIRDRQTNEVVALNWKTINDPSEERRDNIVNSLQVNLEAYYAEELYGKYLDDEYQPEIPKGLKGSQVIRWMEDDLRRYKALPREVAYSQVIYLVKGQRSPKAMDGTDIDTDITDLRDIEKVWRQDSPLCYKWVNLGGVKECPTVRRKGVDVPCCVTGAETLGEAHGADCQLTEKQKAKLIPKVQAEAAWTTRYYEPGVKGYKQIGGGFAKQPVWEADALVGTGMDAVESHVHSLNAGQLFPSQLSDERNLRNPLDKLVIFEQPIYRDRKRQERLREQVISAEMRVAKSLLAVDAMTTADKANVFWEEPMSLDDALDTLFPQHLISCRNPVRCDYDARVCNGPVTEGERKGIAELVQIGPYWQRRIPHHAGEREAFDAREGAGEFDV